MAEKNGIQTAKEAPGRRLLTWFVIAEAILLLGNLTIRVLAGNLTTPVWSNALIAILVTVPMIVLAVRFFQILRTDLDEMLQRIVMEGLAFAMIVFLPIAGLYINLCAAGLVSGRLDPPELLLIPSILAIIGCQISWSRLK